MDISKLEIEKVIEMDNIIRFLNAKGYGIDPEDQTSIKRVYNILIEFTSNKKEVPKQKPKKPSGREFDDAVKGIDGIFSDSFWGGLKKENDLFCEEIRNPKPKPPENRKFDETCFAGFRERK